MFKQDASLKGWRIRVSMTGADVVDPVDDFGIEDLLDDDGKDASDGDDEVGVEWFPKTRKKCADEKNGLIPVGCSLRKYVPVGHRSPYWIGVWRTRCMDERGRRSMTRSFAVTGITEAEAVEVIEEWLWGNCW